MPASKHASTFHRLPIPGDRALLEHGVADRPRRVVLAQPPQVALVVELGGEDVRPERRDPPVEARARLRHQLEHGAVELHDLGAGAPQHEPGGARGAAAAAGLEHAPGARHPEVRVDRQAALEAQEQVLAVGVDRAHGLAGEALRPAVAGEARMRRRELVGDMALEHRADAPGGVVDRVALGHAFSVRRASVPPVNRRSTGDAPPSPPPVAPRPVQPALAGADRRRSGWCSHPCWRARSSGARSRTPSSSRASPRRSASRRCSSPATSGHRCRSCGCRSSTPSCGSPASRRSGSSA